MQTNNYLIKYRERANNVLTNLLIKLNEIPPELREAIEYIALSGGKRIRASLVYATGEALGAQLEHLDYVAAAVELVHAYSLVHDDLPAMDNDDLRHGKPTCHKMYNEATAILVGDALQALAFEILAKSTKFISADICVKMVAILAAAIGAAGMVGGQFLDLAAESKPITTEQLENIHKRKTGALITASVQLGALATGCESKEQLENLKLFAQTMGLAFQVQDDIIDVESSTEILGKQQGADLAKEKATYPALLGMATAKEKVIDLYGQALSCLEKANLSTSRLYDLAQFIVRRSY